MFPFVPDFAREMIEGAGRERERGTLEPGAGPAAQAQRHRCAERQADHMVEDRTVAVPADPGARRVGDEQRLDRSEEHTSELQSLMRLSYAVFCLKKKTHTK